MEFNCLTQNLGKLDQCPAGRAGGKSDNIVDERSMLIFDLSSHRSIVSLHVYVQFSIAVSL